MLILSNRLKIHRLKLHTQVHKLNPTILYLQFCFDKIHEIKLFELDLFHNKRTMETWVNSNEMTENNYLNYIKLLGRLFFKRANKNLSIGFLR